VLNVTGLREGKRLQRPEAQRAFDLWKYAFRPEDVARGHDGLREAYDRFLTTNFPLPDGVSAVKDELGDVKAWRVSAPDRLPGNIVLHFHGGGYRIAGICQPARGRGRRHLLHRRLSAGARTSLSGGDR
jgi:salicylate hydroxylase